MKRILFLIAALTIVGASAQAQKIYSTKTGKITFFSKAPLEDIEAKNNEVESKLAPSNGQVIFTLLIKDFKFPNALMQEHFNDNYMESNKFPKSEFRGYITNIKDINFSKDGSYPAKVKGKLTIHGVTKEIETNGTVDIKGDKVVARNKFNVKLQDYNITGMHIGKKIAETIVVTVDSEYQ